MENIKLKTLAEIFSENIDTLEKDDLIKKIKEQIENITKDLEFLEINENILNNLIILEELLNRMMYEPYNIFKKNILLNFLDKNCEKKIKKDLFLLPLINSQTVNKYIFDLKGAIVNNKITLNELEKETLVDLFEEFSSFLSETIEQIDIGFHNKKYSEIIFIENTDTIIDGEVIFISSVLEFYLYLQERKKRKDKKSVYLIITNKKEFEKIIDEVKSYNYIVGVSLYYDEIIYKKGKTLENYIFEIENKKVIYLEELIDNIILEYINMIENEKENRNKILNNIKDFNLKMLENAYLENNEEFDNSTQELKNILRINNLNKEIRAFKNLKSKIIKLICNNLKEKYNYAYEKIKLLLDREGEDNESN